MGKGDKRRPCLVSKKEVAFRWDYGMGKYPNMTIDEFNQKIEEIRNEE